MCVCVCACIQLILRIFCNIDHFAENEKDGYYLVQDLVNIVDGVEHTSLNPIFSCVLLVDFGLLLS